MADTETTIEPNEADKPETITTVDLETETAVNEPLETVEPVSEAAKVGTSVSAGDIDGQPSPYPPLAPEAPQSPPPSVQELDKLFDTHVRNSAYSTDTQLYNKIHHLYQSLRALLHSKTEA